MKRILSSIILLLSFCVYIQAQTHVKVADYAQKGGRIVRTSALTSYRLMETYPGATVTIYLSGTLTLASIFSDDAGAAPKANPFTADAISFYSFYVVPGRYDIKFSGTGITTPFTIGDVFVAAGSGGGASVTSVFGRTGAVISQTNDYTWAEIDKTLANLADIPTRSAGDLNSGTLLPARMPALTGDITSVVNTVATTITPQGSAFWAGKITDETGTGVVTFNDAPSFLTSITSPLVVGGTAVNSNLVLRSTSGVGTTDNIIFQVGNNGNVEGGRFLSSGFFGLGTITPRTVADFLSTSQPQLRLSYSDNSAYTDFTVGSGGTLTVAPIGNINFNAAGNQIDPTLNFDQNLGQISKKYLSIHAAELFVETLVAQDTIATIGGRILVGPTTQLITDLAPASTTIDVKHNNLFNGDTVYMEVAGSLEFMVITSGASVISGGFQYSVTRNLDGTGANQWFAGDAVFNTGQTGGGFIDLYSIRGVKSATQTGPTIVGNIRNSSTYNDWSENWAIGNLNGLYGYGTTTYGVAFGKYAAGTPHVTIDATNGYRIFNGLSVVVGHWDNTGNITVGEVGANKSNVFITAGQVHLRNNLTDVILLDTTESTITNLLKMKGVNSAISIGVTPPTSASAGTGIWLDRTGMFGLASNVVQAKLDAVTGVITGGGGTVTLDANGLNIARGTAVANRLTFSSPALSSTEYIMSNQAGRVLINSQGSGAFNGEILQFATSIDAQSTAVFYSIATNTSAEFRFAQNGTGTFGVSMGQNSAPATSAVLDLKGTTGALLISRLTTTQRDALTPTDGMIIYNTTTGAFNFREGGAWVLK